MNIYAIGDLHLSFTSDKPMEVFGSAWKGHFDKICKDWREKVKAEDAVLIPGDLSWAMKQEEGLSDLAHLSDLPGKKIFIRGNHDYWWSSITRIRENRPNDSFFFLQTDALRLDEGYVVVGSRGWACPGSPDFSEQDEKLYKREAERFRLAFADANKKRREGDKLIAMIHFPPYGSKGNASLFTELFEQNRVDKVVFGHLHGVAYFPLTSEKNGVEYYLTACDKTNFSLVKIY